MSILSAVSTNNLDALKIAVKKSKKDLRRYYKHYNGKLTAFQIAVSDDSYEVVEWLLANQYEIFKDNKDSFKAPFLNYPVTHLARSVKMLDLLYSYDFMVEEEDGRSFLKDAISNPSFDDIEIFKWGLKHGANPLSGEDSSDFSVFGFVAMRKNIEALELLKPYNPNPDHKDSLGRHILNIITDHNTLKKIMEFSPTLSDRFIKNLQPEEKDICINHPKIGDYVDKFLEFGKDDFLPSTIKDIFLF